MTVTHYLPVFTTRGPGHTQLAICGTYITVHRHSTEPTCPDCAALIVKKDAEDEETAKALEAEFPEFQGRLGAR